MRTLFLITALALCSSTARVAAQTSFVTNDSITVNNIHAGISVHGELWSDPGANGYITRHCEFPANSGKHINFIGSLWMSGYDAGNQLHIAAQTYRQNGSDYWPGPLDGSGAVAYATSYKWAKIWKVNANEIQAFRMMMVHTVYNTPQSILTWPGKGNAYARGNAGYTLTITSEMAPFADLNGNGLYEPLSGEYPDIKGDAAAWWVFSDNGAAHAETNGLPMGVEVHATVYGYKRNSDIDNVLYYDFDIYNKSPNTYTNSRVAIWDDVELGAYMDDYIGFDSMHRMGITYNADPTDGAYAGVPEEAYGVNIPITGLSIVAAPGDAGTTLVPAGSFNAYQNDNTVIGNPYLPDEYNNYMRARIRTGAHITNRFGGAGMPCTPLGTGPDCNYLFPGDPSNAAQWSECQCDSLRGDRRFVLSSNDFTLPAGGSAHIVYALMAREYAGACGTINFNGIKRLADTAWSIYHNPPPPLPVAIDAVSQAGAIRIYPNPAQSELYIADDLSNISETATIAVYNALGQTMLVDPVKTGNNYRIDIARFTKGLYHIRYTNGTVQYATTILKN